MVTYTHLISNKAEYKLRDPKRIDGMLELLREVWVSVPQWRLTQLVINASDTEHDCGPVFFMEDDEFEQRLRGLLEGLESSNINPENQD